MSFTRPPIPAPERKLAAAVARTAIPSPPDPWRLLTNAELAQVLSVSPRFVDDMVAAGFQRIDTRCFFADAVDWLRENPTFRQRVKGD